MDTATPIEVPPLMIDFAADTLSPAKKRELVEIEHGISDLLIGVKQNIFEIGKLLAKAKSVLDHGLFQPWIEQRFKRDLPYSTAHAYMKIYQTFQRDPQAVKLIPFSLLINMKCESFPATIRDIIIENAEHFKKPDIKAINHAYDQFKKGRFDVDHFASIVKKQIERGIEIEKKGMSRRRATNIRSLLGYNIEDSLKAIRKTKDIASHLNDFFPAVEDSKEGEWITKSVEKMIFDLLELKDLLDGNEVLFGSAATERPSNSKQIPSNL